MGLGDFFDSLGNTLKSLGGTAIAPVTTVYDLGSTEYHNAKHGDWWNFGDYLHVVSHNLNTALDPLSNDQTWTGYAFGHTMDALTTAYKEGIDRPISTAQLMAAHALPLPGKGEHFGDLFDPDEWSRAYHIAKSQSLGQGMMFNAFNQEGALLGLRAHDPLAVPDGETPFNQAKDGLPGGAKFLMNAGAFTGDIGVQWLLDPGVLAGKAAGIARSRVVLRQLSEGDRAHLLDQLQNGPEKLTGIKVFVPRRAGLQSRVDQAIEYTQGNNPLRRQLTSPEIYAAFKPMLGGSGKDIADLWGQTLRSDMSAQEKTNTIRRLLAVAGGDQNAILAVGQESAGAKKIADALANLRNGGVSQLTIQELNADARLSPELLGEAQRQIDNLDDSGEVSEFLGKWLGKKQAEYGARAKFLNEVVDTGGTMDFVPGARKSGVIGRTLPGPQAQADKAILRQNRENLLNKTARIFERSRTGESTLWQKSLNQMPLLITKPADILTSPWLKAPAAIDNSLRQVHYIGVANLHDWNGATDQLDSMLRLMGADDETRLSALDKAFSARSEMEKRGAIQHVEHVAMQSFAKKMSAKYGHDIDPDYVQNLVANGQYNRGRSLNSIQGVAYSATTLPADSMLRTAGINRLADETNGVARSLPEGVENPTVDAFESTDGAPLRLALFESQLANKVPLLDAHRVIRDFNTEEKLKRFSELSQSWKEEALSLGALQRRLKFAKAGQVDRLSKAIQAKRVAMDALTDAGQFLTRVWKFSVLMRLGFPQRVLMDDNARIITQVHAASHYLDNGREAGRAWWNNRAPSFINGSGVKANAARKYIDEQGHRKELILEYGHDRPHSDEDFNKIADAAQALTKKKLPAEERANAQAVLDEMDPEGHISEWYSKAAEIDSMRRSIGSLKGNITRWQGELEAGSGDSALLKQKIAKAKLRMAEHEQGIELKQQSIDMDRSPDVVRKELRATNELLIKGKKAFREGEKHIGSFDVDLNLPGVDPVTGKPWAAHGAFAGPYGDSARAAASSNETYHQVLTDAESRRLGAAKTGLWQTVPHTDPGHIYAWQDVLNHQVRNSSVAMWFVKNPESTVGDFRAWLADPARAHLHERLPYLAHDPEAWYHRVKPMVDELVMDDPKLRQAVLDGRVSTRLLAKTDQSMRPDVHGAALDYNTGRNRAARLVGDTSNSIMKFLAEMPTDRLSRQPFFNTIYKTEVREMAKLRYAAVEKTGRQFTEDDLRYIERQARKKALHHVKSYLWDISAHSNAAHMLRFVSPFFAAHQEALNRWWRIAKDDPSVVRRFQLAFDAPRYAGLTYDSQTGEPIKPGDSISSEHRILLRIPWEGDNSTLNKFLRKLGGDKYWSINENGLNTLLQGGLTNPGTGPLVSFPAKVFADRYAQDPEILKAANILTSGYMPETKADAILPGWLQKVTALATKDGRYDSLYSSNLQDRLVKFREANGRTPTDNELDSLAQMAAHDTNRDLIFMSVSNMVSLTPARPNSKYAAIQQGLARIRAQAEENGKDWLWIKDQFNKKYGSIYDMLIASSSANPGAYTGTPAEVGAVKKYASLLGKVDPLVSKIIVGPEAQAKGLAGQYNNESRLALENMKLTPGSKDTLIEAKDPRQIALGSLVDQGWNQYDELTNWLTNTAKQQGLSSFYDSPDLMNLYRAGKQQILDNNFAFRNAWVQASKGDQYDKYLDDMREIVKSKALNDTSRPDISYLKQYLQVRDWVTAVLKARGEAGGSASPESNENQPLMQFFTKYVVALTDQSSMFKKYAYDGLIEHDPLLLGVQ